MLQVSDAVNKVIRSFKITEKIYNERFKGCGQRPILERVTWQSAKYPQYKIVIVYDYWQRSTIELYQQDNKIFSKPEYRTADIAECGKIILENVTK